MIDQSEESAPASPDQEANPQSRRAGPPVWALMLTAVPLFYVLSLGPAVRIADDFELNPFALNYFYSPLIWLHQNTPLKQPLEWYVELWGAR